MTPAPVATRVLVVIAMLAGLILPGCDAAPAYGRVIVSSTGERAYLIAQTLPAGGGEKKFVLFSSIDPERRNWTAPAQYLGEVSGVVADRESVLLVFANGSISSYKYAGGGFQVKRVHTGNLPLVSAAGNKKEILGLSFSAKGFQIYRFDKGSWQKEGPALQVPGNIYAPLLTSFRGQPCVLWLNRDSLKGLENSGARPYRIAWLAEKQWRVEVLPFADLNGAALTAVALNDALAILATGTGPDAKLGEFSIKTGIWDGTTVVEKGGFAGEGYFAAFSGVAISCCRDGKGLLGAVATESGIETFTAPGTGLNFRPPRLLSGVRAAAGMTQSLLLMAFMLFGAIALTLYLALKHRRNFEITAPAEPPPAFGKPEKESAPRLFTPRIGAGGVASPLERALALMIDQLLFIPLIWAFLLAQGIGLMGLVYLSKEELLKILEPVVILTEFVFIVYAAIAEILTGQTLGKRFVGICVRAIEGGRASARRITLRNLIRPLDRFPIPIPFFPALVSMLLSRFNQRLGDRLAGTVVARLVPMSRRRIILASASPRRREALAYLGLAFESMEPQVDETPPLKRTPEEVAMALATRKAEAVNRHLRGGEILIAADTIVVLKDKIIGKPRDREEAREILKKLSGSRHAVITGLAVWDRATGRQVLTAARTEIQMSPLGEQEINDYVDSGEADGKAGAYAIQETGGRFAHIISGSFSNAVGLPLENLSVILRELEA